MKGDTINGWGAPTRVGFGSTVPIGHGIACSNEFVWITFDSDTGGNRQVYAFTMNGTSPSSVAKISNDDRHNGYPDIVIDNNDNPVVVWDNIDTLALLYYLNWSVHDTDVWSEPKTLISMPGSSILPRLVYNSSSFGADWHTLWQNDSTGYSQIYCTDDTTGHYVAVTADTMQNHLPAGIDLNFIVRQMEEPYIVTWDKSSEIFCKRWSNVENISQDAGIDERPDVSCVLIGNKYQLWIVWTSNRFNMKKAIIGRHEEVSPGGVEDEVLATRFNPAQQLHVVAEPNPFRDEVRISLSAPYSEKTIVNIYNIQGQQVITLSAAAHRTILWNGRNEQGWRLPSGIYIVKLNAGTQTATGKLLMVR